MNTSIDILEREIPSEILDILLKDHTTGENIFWGTYPRIFDKCIDPTDYYPSYVSSYEGRNVRSLKQFGNLGQYVKLLSLCTGSIGQILNVSSLAVQRSITEPTEQSWLSILEQIYITYILCPSHENFSAASTSDLMLVYGGGIAINMSDESVVPSDKYEDK